MEHQIIRILTLYKPHVWFVTLTRAGSNRPEFRKGMPLRRIGEKIVEGKNDSSVSTLNFLIIYIFL
jgi:hypothetical protein